MEIVVETVEINFLITHNVLGLNAALVEKLILTTTIDWGCVLALVIGSKIYGL